MEKMLEIYKNLKININYKQSHFTLELDNIVATKVWMNNMF